MRRPTFDLDVLRTFVTGVEFNSFAKAAAGCAVLLRAMLAASAAIASGDMAA